MTFRSIEVAKDEINNSLEKLVNEALSIIDEYWLEWRINNKKLQQIEMQRGLGGESLRGSIVPRIFERTGKTYIEWVSYAPNQYGGRGRQKWGKRIAPRKGPVYHMCQFEKKAQPWELEMIEKTERTLRPIRYAIERMHSTKVYLNSVLVKCNR